ncbi:DUF317 domain-containing protein [Streptomyces sp. TRM66268-LWL]|uniref:DUF317 domain-containing protein n=1 Tax=Streptomyces polyasparticus TaxID=2767826 RepID=A0ABR7SMI1_9ACTN|nr:DUF317 domain-containing protein [Streptomyces polyasparticus]MBC9715706.1 DUF317 domain-containing protein [Streptomyces polyasparticus]
MHLRLDLLDGRPGAVTATITGTPTHTVRALLAVHGFEPLDDTTMVMARIDREEAHYAELAARALRAEGVTVDITPQLREEIDTEWTWANYPMPWCSREEIREVSNDAQHIYDAIRHGRLIIHAHAHDSQNIVAVGTYRDGPSIHLHGENHLRVEALRYDSPTAAIAEFERLYGNAVRPGPAPATNIERAVQQARTAPAPGTANTQPRLATAEPVEVPAADTGNHEGLLKDFLESHPEWEKWRTWSDETTHAVHESLVLRAEFVHEAEADDTQWTIAAYESPVSDRLWHATATACTPVQVVATLLDALASQSAWSAGPVTGVFESTMTHALLPLTDANWKHTVDGRRVSWEPPGKEPVGVQFDAGAAGMRPDSPLPTWTIWGGNTAHQPTWTLHLSARTPSAVLYDVACELAEGLGHRQVSTTASRPARLAAPPPVPSLPGQTQTSSSTRPR